MSSDPSPRGAPETWTLTTQTRTAVQRPPRRRPQPWVNHEQCGSVRKLYLRTRKYAYSVIFTYCEIFFS